MASNRTYNVNEIELDPYLRPVNSPISRSAFGAVNAKDFGKDNSTQYQAIREDIAGQIRPREKFGIGGKLDLSNFPLIRFSRIRGGTAQLGGEEDGNGLLVVYDENGTEIGRWDRTGIVMTAGSISGVSIVNNTVESGTIQDGDILTTAFTLGTISNSLIGTSSIVGGTSASQVINNATVGTPLVTGGTLNNMIVGSPSIVGGTISNPVISGTPTLSVNSGSASLSADGQFAVQTYAGSAILAVRVGGTTFRFVNGGTI